MTVKKTTKPTAKKSSTEAKPGTVAWLIAELRKFPGDMYVVHGDHDSTYYSPAVVEVLPINEGDVDEEGGEDTVCISSY